MTVSFGAGGYVGVTWKASTESSDYNLANTAACVMYADLTSSLLLSKGSGVPTFTRATEAWRFNEQGNLQLLAIGCPSFVGSRLVHNRVVGSSEDFSNAAWTKSNVTVTGTTTIVSTVGASLQRIYGGTLSFRLYDVYAVTARLSYTNHPFVQIYVSSGVSSGYCNFDLEKGLVFDGAGAVGKIVGVSQGVYDCTASIICTTATAASAPILVFVPSINSAQAAVFTGDGVKSFNLLRIQLCCVTGYPGYYIPEYLSVGVDSSPYKGAGVDGAKYFSTDYTGSVVLNNLNGINLEPAATNNLLRSRRFANPVVNDLSSGSAWLCTQTVGSELITNGTFDADANWVKGATWSIAAGVATCTTSTGDPLSQNLVGLIQPGKTYVVTYTITRTTGNIVVSLGSTVNDLGKVRSASGTYTDTIYCGANTTVYFYAYGSFAGTLDNVSIKECAVQITFAQGLDGGTNTATTLTASDTDATTLQSIALGSAARCGSVYVKRRTGTGTISFTIDGGSSWTDITAQINANTWTRVQVTATLTNPSVGFKISSIGDAIDVDCVQLEAGTVATSPIVTTTAVVTRNASTLTYNTAGNISNTAGTIAIEASPVAYSGGAVGSATNGLLLSASNSGATASDGTNTANGPAGTPASTYRLGLRWTGSVQDVSSNGVLGSPGTYDGDLGLSTIAIGAGANGTFKSLSIFNSALTDGEFTRITA